MNTPKPLLLTTEHKEKLEKLVKSGMTPAIIVQRAKILLFKADGRSNDSVADELGINKRTVLHKITKKISEVIKDNQAATQETLIRRLNEVIVGWANYHHSTCAKRSFGTIDHRIWEMLWRWSKRRHPDKSKGWIVRKYWKTHKGRKWTFMSDKNILFLMMDMPIVRKGQMALNKNPFLDPGYFEHRAKKHRLDRKKAICSNRAAQIGYYAL